MVVADAAVFDNATLARADNAAFSLQVVGSGHSVYFAEGVHGFGQSSGLSAIPVSWRWAFAGLLLAGCWPACGRSGVASGRPRTSPVTWLAPLRGDYVDALGPAGAHGPSRRGRGAAARGHAALAAGAHRSERHRRRSPPGRPRRGDGRRPAGRFSIRAPRPHQRCRADLGGPGLGPRPRRPRRHRHHSPTHPDPGGHRPHEATQRPAPEPSPGGGDLLALRARVVAEVRKVVVGQEATVDAPLLAVQRRRPRAARGRARAWPRRCSPRRLAAALELRFRRVQFTPDLHALRRHRHQRLHEARPAASSFGSGPVFTDVLLADEINRTPPKTQAALLEAMEERQVTIDGVDPSAARPVLRHRHPEPDRVRGHLPAARGPARPLPHEGPRRLPRRGRGVRDARLSHRAPGRARSMTCSRRRRGGSRAPRAPVDATRVTPEVAAYLLRIVRGTASCRASPSAPAVCRGALLAVSKAAARAGRPLRHPRRRQRLVMPPLRHRLRLRRKRS